MTAEVVKSEVHETQDEHQQAIDGLKAQRQEAALGGGKTRIEAQHAKGKLTAHERVNQLLDAGSFQEIDAFMAHRHSDFGMDKSHPLGDGLVAGFGKINGRRVCVYAQDFTVLGGSFGEVAGQKAALIMDMAMKAGVPVIAMNDSGGARIQEGVYSLSAYGELFWRNAQASGVVPQICMILGPCAGGAVYSPALTDFIFMARGIGNMFITGPEVIKTVTGEEVDMETLGGAATHAGVSGVAHFIGESEGDTFVMVRKLLEYLPDNNTQSPPSQKTGDEPNRKDASLNKIVPVDPSQTYDMHEIVTRIVDLGSFFEVHASFATNALVGFARLDGESVGIVANQPMSMAGVLDINASDKIARFVRFCDAFNIPIISFTDTPGFMPGTAQEHNGIIRHGAKIVYAYSEATVPLVTVITRKGYGGAYIVMGSKHLHADMVFAWPTAEIAVMGADGAVNILYRKEITGSSDPAAERERLVAEYREKFANPYRAAGSGFVDDVLIPEETRPRLIAALELLRSKQATTMPKKHGCMPL
ncbi:MAG: acyl-CoA carboxylase subunit beta [Anaerolineaceae bacterium]|nr:acyl-CoA carboxylase subunit beta [Anaerolineaceae bacterium]